MRITKNSAAANLALIEGNATEGAEIDTTPDTVLIGDLDSEA
jgi:hypothetical protein